MENFKIQLFSTSQLGVLDIGYAAEQSEIVTDLLFLFNAPFDVENSQLVWITSINILKNLKSVLVNPNWTLLLENSQTLQVTDRH